jgi:hypothetical protein
MLFPGECHHHYRSHLLTRGMDDHCFGTVEALVLLTNWTERE